MPTTSPGAGQRLVAREVGDAEVGELGDPRGAARGVGDDHVLRLDVAVHDAALVRVLERTAECEPDAQDVAVREQPLGAQRVDRAAVDELGDQVARRLVLPGVEDRDDPGMVEPAGGERLALGPRRVAADARRDDLDRDGALQALVGGRVDGPEPTRAEPVPEPVATEDELGCGRRGELVCGLHHTRVRCKTGIPSDPPVILDGPTGPAPSAGPRRGEPEFVLLRRGRRARSHHPAHADAQRSTTPPRHSSRRRGRRTPRRC